MIVRMVYTENCYTNALLKHAVVESCLNACLYLESSIRIVRDKVAIVSKTLCENTQGLEP